MPESWRDSVAGGTLTVCALVGPLLAALGLFVGSTEREALDVIVLASAGVLLPALRLGRTAPVQSRAIAAIFVMFGAALYLTARAGFAAGATGVVVSACVLAGIIHGRALGLALIGVSAVAHVIIGILVVKGVFLLDPREVDPLVFSTWFRIAASTSLLAVLLALVIDFVIRHLESSARATATALKELRAVHEALRESEERYRSLVDHCLDGVLLTTPLGEVLEANPAACQLLQRTPEEIRALGRYGIVDLEDPRIPPLLEERQRTGKLRGELNLIRKDGKRIPVEVGSAGFRDRNGELRSSVSIRDLTHRRRRETEQRTLAELGAVLSPLQYESSLIDVAPLVARNLADIVSFYVVQADGDVQRVVAAAGDPAQSWMADAAMSSLGATVRPDHPVRAVVRDRTPIIRQFAPESLEGIAESPEHLRALRTMRLRSSMIVPLTIGDVCYGALALASSSRAFDEADLPLALEIGRRCALFIESARLHRSEQSAIQARDDVLAIVAHDLRNDLATIMIQLALLGGAARTPEPQSLDTVEAVEHAARRMSRTIRDLLDVTKFESGQLELYRTGVSPAEVIAAVSQSQSGQVRSQSLELRTAVAPDLPDVWADRSRALQVLENLIDNATRFTSKGSISLGARPGEGEVVFSVTDTGQGIAPEDVAHVFDRFWQARRSKRSTAGMGLAIVREIVQAHGGRLWVESKLGSGSTFLFTLPTMALASKGP